MGTCLTSLAAAEFAITVDEGGERSEMWSIMGTALVRDVWVSQFCHITAHGEAMGPQQNA